MFQLMIKEEERRRQVRYAISCPVTVFTPGRGRKRAIGSGWLRDINDLGARFESDRRLAVDERVSLEVHFSNPDGAVTIMRFPARVKRISEGTAHEIAVSFLKGGTFVRRKGTACKNKSGIWIN